MLRRVHTVVSEKLDAPSVAREMFQSNALTLKELESIQSKHSEPVKAAEQLLNIVMNQSDNVYAFFMNALKLGNQNHVYETIVIDSYIGKSCYLEQRQCYFRCYMAELSYVKPLFVICNQLRNNGITVHKTQSKFICINMCVV